MKTGLNLVQLATQIEQQAAAKHDVIFPTKSLYAVASVGDVRLRLPAHGEGEDARWSGLYPVRDIAHNQIATHLNIPTRYYDRMRSEAPELLANNINTWIGKRGDDDRRMIRTINGDVRAVLSNRYNRIENEEIASVALPILRDLPGCRIVSAEITERRMYIQATTDRIRSDVKVGDAVQAGVIISNSEVGHGAVNVSPMIYRLVCLNGMVMPDRKFRAYHVGRQIEDNADLWRDDTRAADDRAVLLKVRDMIAAAVDAVKFEASVNGMRALADRKVEGNPEKAIEVLAKKIGATDGERGGLLRSLIEGGDLSAWGMLNAVTHQAHTVQYDRGVEFETAGGALLSLPASEWTEILQAA